MMKLQFNKKAPVLLRHFDISLNAQLHRGIFKIIASIEILDEMLDGILGQTANNANAPER